MKTAEQSIVTEVLEKLAIEPINSGACWGEWIAKPSGAELASVNPADGSVIARVKMAGSSDYNLVVERALDRFRSWRPGR